MSWACTLASGHRDPCRPSRARLQRRDAEHQPVSAKDLAFTLPPSAWQTVRWRQGSRGDLSGRFATVRVRPSHRDYWRAEPHPEEWLLIEWPEGDKEPSKYWLSTLPATTALVDLVHTAKLRWRIERDYQDLKQELIIMKGGVGAAFIITPPCALWLPRSRAKSFPPSRALPTPSACATPRLAAPRASRCGRNAITHHRSPRCAAA